MAVVVLGVDHRRAPLELLERIAMPADRLDETLALLDKSDHITEVVALSTCMRTEIYVDAVRFHPALDDIQALLSRAAGLPFEELAPAVFEFHDEAAHRHLFRVAAGVESAVIGEGEILGQVSRAWDHARQFGTCRTVLGALFRRAVEVGKRVRSETAVSRGITSIGQAAVIMATQRLGGLADKKVAVVGAGDMGNSMAVALSCTKGVDDVLICNRTAERAGVLAERVDGIVIPWDQRNLLLAEADLVLTSTGASEVVFGVEDVNGALAQRNGRPLVMVDVAVPRDVAAEVAELPRVSLLTMADLHAFTAVGREERGREVGLVEAIVEEEIIGYSADVNARLVTPVVRALRDRADFIRTAELDRYASKIDRLSPADRELVEAVTKSMMAKLLHDPTVRLKDAAGTPEGERMAEALRLLFGI